MLAFLIGVSVLVSFVVGTLPRKFPHWTNIPNRDYWLSPARQEESLRYLSTHGKRLGCLIVMMMLGMHYVILKANHTQPPHARRPFQQSFGFALALIGGRALTPIPTRISRKSINEKELKFGSLEPFSGLCQVFQRLFESL